MGAQYRREKEEERVPTDNIILQLDIVHQTGLFNCSMKDCGCNSIVEIRFYMNYMRLRI